MIFKADECNFDEILENYECKIKVIVCDEGHEFYATLDEKGLIQCPECGIGVDLG